MEDVPPFDVELVPGTRSGALARRWRFAAWAALALVAACVVWQGYRNPDLLLGLASFRLC